MLNDQNCQTISPANAYISLNISNIKTKTLKYVAVLNLRAAGYLDKLTIIPYAEGDRKNTV